MFQEFDSYINRTLLSIINVEKISCESFIKNYSNNIFEINTDIDSIYSLKDIFLEYLILEDIKLKELSYITGIDEKHLNAVLQNKVPRKKDEIYKIVLALKIPLNDLSRVLVAANFPFDIKNNVYDNVLVFLLNRDQYKHSSNLDRLTISDINLFNTLVDHVNSKARTEYAKK